MRTDRLQVSSNTERQNVYFMCFNNRSYLISMSYQFTQSIRMTWKLSDSHKLFSRIESLDFMKSFLDNDYDNQFCFVKTFKKCMTNRQLKA